VLRKCSPAIAKGFQFRQCQLTEIGLDIDSLLASRKDIQLVKKLAVGVLVVVMVVGLEPRANDCT